MPAALPQVLRSGCSRSLDPMNPYERRIIHTEIQNISGVTSNSVGDGDSRRVVISPKGGAQGRNTGSRAIKRIKKILKIPSYTTELIMPKPRFTVAC